MSRTPPAMRTLIRQVQALRDEATFEVSNNDGFGRPRTVTFDYDTSEWLSPLIDIFRDGRIAEVHRDSDEHPHLHVTFVGDARADSTEPFLIREVIDVLEDSPEDREPDSVRTELAELTDDDDDPETPEVEDTIVDEFADPTHSPEARAARKKELHAISVAELRETYGYDDESKKKDIIDEILADEGYVE